MTSRQSLHALLDSIPAELLGQAEGALAGVCALQGDPFWQQLINAEVDYEPLSAKTIAAIERGWESHRAGLGISTEQLLKLLGDE